MATRRWLLVVLVLPLLVYGLAAPASAATTIQLTGTVTNTDGVAQDGTVCLELVGGGSCGGTYLTAGAWSMTWTEGDQEPGDYLVRVSSSTMDGTSRWYVAGDDAGTTDKASATPVHLAVGEPDFDFTMVMPAIAKVTGRVVDTSAVGVPGLPVLINELGAVRSTTSGPGGAYDLGYTRAGTWQVVANGGGTYAAAQTAVTVPATGSVVVDDLVVQLPGSISGQVTDAGTGAPVPFIDVFALQAAAPHTFLGGGKTDLAGHYVVDGLGNTPLVLQYADFAYGGYTTALNDGGDPITYTSLTPIVLGEGEQKVRDQTLSAKPSVVPASFSLSGTVTDEGQHPLAGIDVTIGSMGATTNRLGHWYMDAPDGTYVLNVLPGTDWASAFDPEPGWASESYPGRLVSPTPSPVTVAGGVGADHLDLTLVRSVTNSAAPSISGGATVGQTLAVSQGTWAAPSGTTYATTWLRDGVPIGAGQTHVVVAADAGRSLQARVTATYGLAVTHADAAPRTVDRVTSTATLSAAARKHRRVTLTVSVSAPGLAPTGTVDVVRGDKVVKHAVALVDGRVVVKLKRQRPGRQRYSVVYSGDPATIASSSPVVRVKVRK
jgi:hypothetical protein